MTNDTTKLNFDEIPSINVDCAISLGEACRVAATLKRNNKRFFSSPFDWMMCYKLDDFLSSMSDLGKNFFQDCSVKEELPAIFTRRIIDNKTGMVSLHDFPMQLPAEKASKFFQKKFKYKFQRLNYILKKANKICIMTHRKINNNEIKTFLEKFKKLYKFDYIYFININDSKTENFEIFNTENTTIWQIYFNDEHENGRNIRTNSLCWLGNVGYWDKIATKIRINNTFVEKIKRRNSTFRMDYNYSTSLQRVFTIFGVKISFKVKL